MENIAEQMQERQSYETPAIVFESVLEVRAGTPIPGLFSDFLTDPAGLQQ